MNNFMKKATVTLTVVLMVLSMVVGASAAGAAGTSCSGNIGSTNVYSVYSNANSTCNIQGIDVNSLLGKLSSYGCPEASADTANVAAAQDSVKSATVPSANCNCAGCTVNGCTGAECTSNNCSAGNCTTSTCTSGSGCAANACTKTSNQTAVESANETGSCAVNSSLTNGVSGAAAKYAAAIKKLCKISYGTAITTAAPKPSESVTPTPSASTTPTSDSGSVSVDNQSFEQQVLELVNEQRAAIGLSPLTLSTELSNAARAKSQDMSDNNYFSHTSPSYGSPFDMLKSFGISYSTAGENIAMGYATPQAVMNAWMNSAGHRANILNSSFTQIGIGYVADGNYWTQEFIG